MQRRGFLKRVFAALVGLALPSVAAAKPAVKFKHGKLNADLAADGTASMTVWAWHYPTGEKIPVITDATITVESGKRVMATWDESQSRYVIVAAEC